MFLMDQEELDQKKPSACLVAVPCPALPDPPAVACLVFPFANFQRLESDVLLSCLLLLSVYTMCILHPHQLGKVCVLK